VKERKIGSAVIRLLQGDITTCDVDAVINVTGKQLRPKELDAPPEPIADLLVAEGEESGEVVISLTEAEDLKAQHVLNTSTVRTTATAGANKIRKTIRCILETAQQKKFKSLAIPAIGSGINRYPLERTAEILLEELAKSVQQPDNSLERVIFVLHNQKSYRIFEQILNQFEQAEHDKL